MEVLCVVQEEKVKFIMYINRKIKNFRGGSPLLDESKLKICHHVWLQRD